MRLAVIGTGHVGLVSCASFAALGHEVVGVDTDARKIEAICEGRSPFFEPGLEELMTQEMGAGRLSFTTETAEAVAGAEVVFICVGTPPRASGEANLVAVEQAARQVARHATGSVVVAEKSTVPAGTAPRLWRVMAHERPDLAEEFFVASNPEFLREGSAVHDSLNPDRILVGAEYEAAFEAMRRVYKPLTDKGTILIETNIATAEIAKHASNAFLAMKISYANALARLCEKAGGDVVAVADVMGADPRIGRAFLDAGLGYGGYCFPKDLAAFTRLSSQLGYEFSILSETERINNETVEACVHKVEDALWNLEDKTVALFGLSFKPGTDDIRFSPALAVAERLLQRGARVVGYDPHAMDEAKAELPALELASNPYAAAAGAHAVVIGTEWAEFRSLDLMKLKEVMAFPVVVDGRNIYDPPHMRSLGFTYCPMGRSSTRDVAASRSRRA